MCSYAVYSHYEATKTAKSAFLYLQCIVVYGRIQRARQRRVGKRIGARLCWSLLFSGTKDGYSRSSRGDKGRPRSHWAGLSFVLLTADIVYGHNKRKYQLPCQPISGHAIIWESLTSDFEKSLPTVEHSCQLIVNLRQPILNTRDLWPHVKSVRISCSNNE